jgi:hypothetical protein
MTKQTIKTQLLNRIRKSGKAEVGLSYKEVITHILKLTRGEHYQVDWRSNDRGHYAGAMRRGTGVVPNLFYPSFASIMGGYLVNGGGTEGLIKNSEGKYIVRTFSKEEQNNYQARKTAALSVLKALYKK